MKKPNPIARKGDITRAAAQTKETAARPCAPACNEAPPPESAGTATVAQFTPATAAPVFSQRLHNAHSALASVHAASVDRLRASRRAQAKYPAVPTFRGEVFQNLLACDRTRGAIKWLDSKDRASVRTLALQFIRCDRGMRRQIAAERKAAA